MKRSVLIGVAVLALTTWGEPTGGADVADCMQCHGEPGQAGIPSISRTDYKNSVHGKVLDCRECHTRIDTQMHGMIQGDGAVDCNLCHEQVNRHAARSMAANRPQCHTCHTRHRIHKKTSATSSVHPRQLRKTCRQCHPVECGQRNLLSFLPSIRVASHAKQDFSLTYDDADCVGCHQGEAAHGEEEPISAQQCYKCHSQRANPEWMGYIHTNADLSRQPAVFFAGVLHLALVVFLGGWGLRSGWRRMAGRHRRDQEDVGLP
ncbi:MAG: hypothetical protein JSW39_12440 [Desulfobacterales bacterium]|nr:MAG: hypothetical protein JSW39_12440 [Desulfobacterales bacterium]